MKKKIPKSNGSLIISQNLTEKRFQVNLRGYQYHITRTVRK